MIRALLLLVTVGCAPALLAQPITYDFQQSGFAEGATVTGFFVGEDLNDDGQLTSFDGEVIDFSMTFSGNSIVPAFTLGMDNLNGLVYDLDGGPLGDGLELAIEGILALDDVFSYSVGPGPFALCDGQQDCAAVSDGDNQDTSPELVQVSARSDVAPLAVPIPSWAIVLLALILASIGMTTLGRRRTAA